MSFNFSTIKEHLPGLFLTCGITLLAWFATPWVPYLGHVSMALLLGIVAGNILPLHVRYTPGIKFSEVTLLSTAVILMGLNLQLRELVQLGPLVVLLIVPMVILTLLTSLGVGKLFGLSPSLSLLLGVGNAVCGSSAIVSVSPITQAKEEEIGMSIGIVNLLGTVGMLVLPLAALQFKLSELESSYLIGGSIQAVGQVVAAGYSLSTNIGDTATLVKMFRVLMIVPLVLFIPLFLHKKKEDTRKSKRKLVPGYLIGFVICSILGTVIGAESTLIISMSQVGKIILMIAMVAIGIKIKFSSIIHQAPRVLVCGLVIAIIQIAFVFIYLLLFRYF